MQHCGAFDNHGLRAKAEMGKLKKIHKKHRAGKMVVKVDPGKIAYMAVPKAACSSVKAALAAIDPNQPGNDPGAYGQKQVHSIYPTQRFRMHRWERVNSYFRFTVVRDPLKRLLAVYTNRVVALGELHNCRNINRGRFNLPADPDPDFFFQNLAQYIAASSSIKHHALPTVVFTGADLGRYSRVYRTDEIALLEQDLSGHMDQQVRVPHFNSSEKRLTLDDLKPETHRALAARLNSEYRHLEDHFFNPFPAVRAARVA